MIRQEFINVKLARLANVDDGTDERVDKNG